MSNQSINEVDNLRQIWESNEMWDLRKNFLKTYWRDIDKRFSRNRLLCLSQMLINIEFLGCTYKEKLMAEVGEMADDMVQSRRERRREVIEKVFVQKKEASSSTTNRNEQKPNLKRKIDEDQQEIPKKKTQSELVDLGGGFWRQTPSQETPVAETKLKSMQLLKAQISIAPTELGPLELLNFSCNRCKFDWNIEFDTQASLCSLKIEKVSVVKQKYWGDEQRGRVEACRKANNVLQRTFLEIRAEEDSSLSLFTSRDMRKSWEGPSEYLLEPLAVALQSVKRRLKQKDFSKWRLAAYESLQNACQSEGVPFEVKRVHMEGWREDVQVQICGMNLFCQQGKVAPKGKEIESANEVCLKAIEILMKQSDGFKIEENEGKLIFLQDAQIADVPIAQVESKNGSATSTSAATVDQRQIDLQLRTLKHHLISIDGQLNSITRLDQACNKAKVPYLAEVTGTGPFECTVTVAGAATACASDTSKKGAKSKACDEAIKMLEKVYIQVIQRDNRLIIISSDEPDAQETIVVDCAEDARFHDFVLLQHKIDQSMKSILHISATFNHSTIKFEQISIDNHKFKSTIYLNDIPFAHGIGSSKKEADDQAAQNTIEKFRRTNHTIFIKSGVDSEQSEIDLSISNQKLDSEQSIGNNFGAKLMAKMGWSGGGIGRNEQGIKKPIELMECFQHQGFGSAVDKRFCAAVRSILQDYAESSKLDDLVFSVALRLLHKSCRSGLNSL